MISLLAPEDHQPGHPRLASAGRVSFGWEVQIADPASGAWLPPEQAGEVLIRGECLFTGYWRDPEATAAAFTADGWYRTGDIGRLTADGYLYILDRATDMVISGGENIYPAEVEAVLARHPAVAEVAVIGRARPGLGRGRARGDQAGRRRGRHAGRDHRLVPGPAGPLQVPEDRRVHRAAAAHHDRQGAQARAACTHSTAAGPSGEAPR